MFTTSLKQKFRKISFQVTNGKKDFAGTLKAEEVSFKQLTIHNS